MKKLTKKDKDTDIYYNQSGDPVLVRTHDLKLIRKLIALAAEYPESCRVTDEGEYGEKYFDVDKNCISIHVIKPFSEERRKRQSEWAKEHGINGTKRIS